jgi:cell wall-associated NlpC family hydrolase
MEATQLEAAPMDVELLDDELAQDKDDYDLLVLPDPATAKLDPVPASEGDDTAVAKMAPHKVATHDAPIRGGIGIAAERIAEIARRAAEAFEAYLRWLGRLRFRKELLDDAKAELADARGEAEIDRAKRKVAQRKVQVARAQRMVDNLRPPETTILERVQAAAMLGHKHKGHIAYSQGADRWDGIARGRRSKNGQVPRAADCSSFVTWCYWDALGGPRAGADIINGDTWRAGYTGTQTHHGWVVPAAKARVGDLVFYRRRGVINHVTIVVAPGRVVSHGSAGGPYLENLNYDGTMDHVRRYVD